MKQLLLGILIGALAVILAQALLKSEAPLSDAAAPAGKTSVLVSAPATPCKSDVAQLTAPAVAAVRSTPVNAEPAITTEPPTAADDADCPCYRGHVFRKAEREAAARRAEPKDEWSYNTEQGLQQLIAGHPQGNQFEISNIDCRKTFCEIRGTAAATYAAESIFMQVIKATLQQDSLGLERNVFQGYDNPTNDGKREMAVIVKRRSP